MQIYLNNYIYYIAQATFGKITCSDWLRRVTCQFIIFRIGLVWITLARQSNVSIVGPSFERNRFPYNKLLICIDRFIICYRLITNYYRVFQRFRPFQRSIDERNLLFDCFFLLHELRMSANIYELFPSYCTIYIERIIHGCTEI